MPLKPDFERFGYRYTMAQKPKVLVVGLGKSGFSMVEFLFPWAELDVIDSRTTPPDYENCIENFPHLSITCGPFQESYDGYDFVCLSPGISRQLPFVRQFLESGIPVIGDIELFASLYPERHTKIVAITGSNGKSTTTMLTAHLLSCLGVNCWVAGNIGVPPLNLLDRITQSGWPDVIVLELSSFQLDGTHNLHKDVAAILNISPDHMDMYSSFESYCSSKKSIYQHSIHQIFNKDDHQTTPENLDGHGLSFSYCDSDSDFYILDKSLYHKNKKIRSLADLTDLSWANTYNLLASIAIISCLGKFSLDKAIDAYQSFQFLPHRLTKVASIHNISFYNDSKATNVGATISSLKTFQGHAILLLGGLSKGQDFFELRSHVCRHAKNIFIFGEDALKISSDLIGTIPITIVEKMTDAIDLAYQTAKEGDAILLSPACSSFDQFDHYMHRGRVFCDYVKKIQAF